MYKKIINEMNRYGIGFRRPYDVSMRFLCGYYPIDNTIYEAVEKRGKLLLSVFNKANRLYRRAIMRNDKLLLKYFETGILRNKTLRTIHRRSFLEQRQRLPFVFRGDTTNLEQFVEFHCGFKGLGFIYALRGIMEKNYGKSFPFNQGRLKDLLSSLVLPSSSGKTTAIYCDSSWQQLKEVRYFIDNVFGCKVRSVNLESAFLAKPHVYGLIDIFSIPLLLHVSPSRFYRILKKRFTGRGGVKSMVAWIDERLFPFWGNFMKRYFERKIDTEPPPNLLYENKMILPLMRDKKYCDYFTGEERSIFPETHTIQRNKRIRFQDSEYSFQDIIDLPRKHRKFVVKYAGLDVTKNYGGRSVYRLTKQTVKFTKSLLQAAMLSYERRGEPWVIQPDVSCRNFVHYFNEGGEIKNENLYSLYRPYFVYNAEKDRVDTLDIGVIFHKIYKVTGGKNNIRGLVTVL